MPTPAELLAQSLAKLQTANRIDGNKNSYRRDNPTEYGLVVAYLKGGPRPSGVASDMGIGLMLEEDARRALATGPTGATGPGPTGATGPGPTGATGATGPPVPAGILTGTHWAEPHEYAQLKSIGYDFNITLVAPGDINSAKAKLDAAKSAGIKLILGLYGYGGPEPYVLSGSNWIISTAAQNSLNYLESRESEIIATFVFNEPYWVMGLSAAQLRSLRTQIKGVWPNAKIYHDIGNAHFWPGQDQAKWGDQSGTVDYCGSWYYPFKDAGVGTYPRWKTYGLEILQKEVDFIKSNIGGGAKMVWLGQTHAAASDNIVYPTTAHLKDWNDACRAAMPADSLLSWYVWRQALYPDFLANHPEQWSSTV